MKRNKNLCVILIVFLFVLIGITAKSNTSRAAKALRIPAEFKSTNEKKIWDQYYTMVDIQYGDAKVKLSDSMNVSFDVYAPKKLFCLRRACAFAAAKGLSVWSRNNVERHSLMFSRWIGVSF